MPRTKTLPLEKRTWKINVRQCGLQLFERKIGGIHTFWKEEVDIFKYVSPPLDLSTLHIQEDEVWLAQMTEYINGLRWLLNLPYHKFWSQLVYHEETTDMLHSYLQFAAAPLSVICQYSNHRMKTTRCNIHGLVYDLIVRLTTPKESESNFMTPELMGEILFNNDLLIIAELFDICKLYGKSNKKEIRDIIVRLLELNKCFSLQLKDFVVAQIKMLYKLEANVVSISLKMMKSLKFAYKSNKLENVSYGYCESEAEEDECIDQEYYNGGQQNNSSLDNGGLESDSQRNFDNVGVEEFKNYDSMECFGKDVLNILFDLADIYYGISCFLFVYKPIRSFFHFQQFEIRTARFFQTLLLPLCIFVEELSRYSEDYNRGTQLVKLVNNSMVKTFNVLLLSALDFKYKLKKKNPLHYYVKIMNLCLPCKSFICAYNDVYNVESELKNIVHKYSANISTIDVQTLIDKVLHCYEDTFVINFENEEKVDDADNYYGTVNSSAFHDGNEDDDSDKNTIKLMLKNMIFERNNFTDEQNLNDVFVDYLEMLSTEINNEFSVDGDGLSTIVNTSSSEDEFSAESKSSKSSNNRRSDKANNRKSSKNNENKSKNNFEESEILLEQFTGSNRNNKVDKTFCHDFQNNSETVTNIKNVFDFLKQPNYDEIYNKLIDSKGKVNDKNDDSESTASVESCEESTVTINLDKSETNFSFDRDSSSKDVDLQNRVESDEENGSAGLSFQTIDNDFGDERNILIRKKSDGNVLLINQENEEATGQIISEIEHIKELFPNFGDGYIKVCLDHYNGNVDNTVSAILEGTLPESVKRFPVDLPLIVEADNVEIRNELQNEYEEWRVHDYDHSYQNLIINNEENRYVRFVRDKISNLIDHDKDPNFNDDAVGTYGSCRSSSDSEVEDWLKNEEEESDRNLSLQNHLRIPKTRYTRKKYSGSDDDDLKDDLGDEKGGLKPLDFCSNPEENRSRTEYQNRRNARSSKYGAPRVFSGRSFKSRGQAGDRRQPTAGNSSDNNRGKVVPKSRGSGANYYRRSDKRQRHYNNQ